ncbi:hypothetical protein [Oryza sativa Japonica Group]|uniref:Uncharacterized protein n=1 Tax=Oryza sativa subsp. japonica TaxID=39947 RepID=Q5QNC7_ORYSJ|nr:hypothetical protein [Oryza sativa Japonica Group]
MNVPRTQKWHDQLGQNSQVCREEKSRRLPAENGLDWTSPWFGRTRGFGRTLICSVGCRVWRGRPGLLPNDG